MVLHTRKIRTSSQRTFNFFTIVGSTGTLRQRTGVARSPSMPSINRTYTDVRRSHKLLSHKSSKVLPLTVPFHLTYSDQTLTRVLCACGVLSWSYLLKHLVNVARFNTICPIHLLSRYTLHAFSEQLLEYDPTTDLDSFWSCLSTPFGYLSITLVISRL